MWSEGVCSACRRVQCGYCARALPMGFALHAFFGSDESLVWTANLQATVARRNEARRQSAQQRAQRAAAAEQDMKAMVSALVHDAQQDGFVANQG